MKWVVVLIVLVGVILFFMNQGETSRPPAQAPATQSAPATPEVIATPAPAMPAPPAPAAAPAIDPNLIQRMQQVARQSGVQLTNFQPQQGSAWIMLVWRGENKALGGDCLEALQRQGLIRDFDVDNAKYGMAMQNGAPVNTAQYLVRF